MWLTKAREDFAAARLLFGAGLTDTACYHCQQASEKFLKAILEENDKQIPRTHDLDALIQHVADVVHISDEVRGAANLLSGFGVAVRYPGTDTDLEDAKEALDMTKIILDWAESIWDSVD